jgi:transcriptional regulator with XRE-family HTH domain
MTKLADLVKAPGFELEVKQFECVLDYVTAVEQAMEAKQVTQSALAKTLGKTRSWVSKILRKKPNLTFFTAVELADALEMDVEVRVVNRLGARVAVLGQTSEVHVLAAPYEETQAWSSADIQMRPIVEAKIIPLPRAA